MTTWGLSSLYIERECRTKHVTAVLASNMEMHALYTVLCSRVVRSWYEVASWFVLQERFDL